MNHSVREINSEPDNDSLLIYKTLFDNASDPIIIWEIDTEKALKFNRKASEVYGYSEEEFLNISLSEITRDYSKTKNHLKELINGGKNISFECIHFNKKKEEIFFEINASLIEFNGIKAVLAINRDITKRKKSEEEIKNYSEVLKGLNENKDKFFNIISHDLRSPFSSLLGYSEILINEIDNLTKSEIKEIAESLNITSSNLLSFTEALLTWSRLQIGKHKFNPEKIKLISEAAFVINLLKGKALSKKIMLHNYIDTDCIVYADKLMVVSILQNLLSNAIKFTKINGIVEIYSVLKENYWEIFIHDSGVGIPKDNMKKLFNINSFFSTNGTAEEKGTGIGLILSKEFIEINGGQISVISEENKGSCFSFTLPKAK